MIKSVLIAAVTLILLIFAMKNLKVEEDLVKSLIAEDTTTRELFDFYHRNSFFRDKIFIDYKDLKAPLRLEIETLLAQNGYHKSPHIAMDKVKWSYYNKLLTLLSPTEIKEYLAPHRAEGMATRIVAMLLLPGSRQFVHTIREDPLGLGRALLSQRFQRSTNNSARSLEVYQRKKRMSYNEIGVVYTKLMQNSSSIDFIGGDLFAYENYLAIKDDIYFCVMAAIPLNLLLFFLFCRNLYLVGFLVLGSCISYATGLTLVRLFHTQIFTIVFAFTSTFIGFNNEYVVHLSGIDKGHTRGAIIGLGSAIGTTFIGFLILLFTKSIILKQIALISVGAMIGFVGFLLLYQNVLKKINFKLVKLPKVNLANWTIWGIWVIGFIAITFLPFPRFVTDIETFKYQSETLEEQAVKFTKKLHKIGMSSVYAIPISGDLYENFQILSQDFLEFKNSHPLSWYRSEREQEAAIKSLRKLYPKAITRLTQAIEGYGIKLGFKTDWLFTLRPLGAEEFLRSLTSFTPLPFYHRVDSKLFLYLPLNDEVKSDGKNKAVPMAPKGYYDSLLTHIERHMVVLFLAGFVVMFIYLFPLQRTLSRLLYIFTPLLVTIGLFCGYLAITHKTVNIVHIMGFCLVIALALDYSSISISTGFAIKEMSKILLTGLSTLISFGVLCLAKHPFLKDLGQTVTLGTAAALVFTLFFRVKTEKPPMGEGVR